MSEINLELYAKKYVNENISGAGIDM